MKNGYTPRTKTKTAGPRNSPLENLTPTGGIENKNAASLKPSAAGTISSPTTSYTTLLDNILIDNALVLPRLSDTVPSDSVAASYIELVGAIIRSGLKQEGPDYLLTDGGQYWCYIGNLDPAAVRRLAVGSPQLKRRRFSPAEGRKEVA